MKADFSIIRNYNLRRRPGRNKRLGLWAPDELGFSGAKADLYAREVVLADFDEPGDNDVLRKIFADFEKGSVAIDPSKLDMRWIS